MKTHQISEECAIIKTEKRTAHLVLGAYLTLLVVVFSGCGGHSSSSQDPSIDESDNIVVDSQVDHYGNPIQKMVFDKDSGYTYIYTFTYEKEIRGAYVCVDSRVIILDDEGKVIEK